MSSAASLLPDTIPQGYCSQAADTHPAADIIRFQLYRQHTIPERLQLADKFRQHARQISYQCLCQRFPDLTGQAMLIKIAKAWLQEKYPIDYVPRANFMNASSGNPPIATLMARILNDAQIPYYVTGGVAAIAYGEPRATIDLDIVIAIELSNLSTFATYLENQGFYVAGLGEVLGGQLSCFNITHLDTVENVDLMISGTTEFDLQKLGRRQLYTFPDGAQIALATPEDVVLSKLIWRRESQSDKQWRDILGILKVQQEKLDFVYIRQWVDQFELENDWQRALVAAGVSHLG
jgi:hypothetical protein